MTAPNNPPQWKIDSNLALVESQWRRLISAIPRSLLEGMRKVTYLIKTDIATRKLQGQLVNQRMGNLIRALLPNSEEQAGSIEGNTVVGIVGLQGNKAPYGRRLEEGGPSYTIVPAPGRPFRQSGTGAIRDANDPRARLRFIIGGQEVFVRSVVIPAMRPRRFIAGTIEEDLPKAREVLRSAVIVEMEK